MPGFSEFMFGAPFNTKQIPLYTPEQLATMTQLRNMGMQGLQQNLDFNPIEQQARTGFAQRTVPSLAERFTQLGGGGGQASSAFGQQLGAAGAGLEEALAAMKSQRQMGLLDLFKQLTGAGLTQQFENFTRPEDSGFVGESLKSLVQVLPTAVGAYFGVPVPPAPRPQNQPDYSKQFSQNMMAGMRNQPQFGGLGGGTSGLQVPFQLGSPYGQRNPFTQFSSGLGGLFGGY